MTARCAEPVVAIYSRITLLCYRVECHQLICIISAADVIIASLIRYGAADGSSTSGRAIVHVYVSAYDAVLLPLLLLPLLRTLRVSSPRSPLPLSSPRRPTPLSMIIPRRSELAGDNRARFAPIGLLTTVRQRHTRAKIIIAF